MENLTNAHIPLKSSDVAWQLVDGEAVVLHIPGQMLRGLNVVASGVWQRIDGIRTIEMIAQEVSLEYFHMKEEVIEDVKTFVAKLFERNMVTFSDLTSSRF